MHQSNDVQWMDPLQLSCWQNFSTPFSILEFILLLQKLRTLKANGISHKLTTSEPPTLVQNSRWKKRPMVGKKQSLGRVIFFSVDVFSVSISKYNLHNLWELSWSVVKASWRKPGASSFRSTNYQRNRCWSFSYLWLTILCLAKGCKLKKYIILRNQFFKIYFINIYENDCSVEF